MVVDRPRGLSGAALKESDVAGCGAGEVDVPPHGVGLGARQARGAVVPVELVDPADPKLDPVGVVELPVEHEEARALVVSGTLDRSGSAGRAGRAACAARPAFATLSTAPGSARLAAGSAAGATAAARRADAFVARNN